MKKSIRLSKPQRPLSLHVPLTASKSESNRVLLINQLGDGQSRLHNLSKARDTQIMSALLASEAHTLDALDAGTVMRFMTAYLAIGTKERRITGTLRMCQRPIGMLVEALNTLGAQVGYAKQSGYPPLWFRPFEQQKNETITIAGHVSSQYISALLMIAPTLPKGLTLTLEGEIYSRPYLEMTLHLMAHFGVKSTFSGRQISVKPQPYQTNSYTIESDWSGAAYWYSWFALAEDAEITLQGLRSTSHQGDSQIAHLMEGLGVRSVFENHTVRLVKGTPQRHLKMDFKSCPDLAQTIMACAIAKGVSLEMTGLESLKIKESDRTAAMAHELAKVGATLSEHEKGHWLLTPPSPNAASSSAPAFRTYDDHRMAMALAPLCYRWDCTIEAPEVVVKSYPAYWEHLKMAGVPVDS